MAKKPIGMLIIVASALLGGGQAFAQSDDEIRANVDSYLLEKGVASYITCAKTKVGAIDDRISDASTVAVGVEAACTGEFNALTAGMNSSRSRSIQQALRPQVVAVVLRSRADAQASKRPSPPTQQQASPRRTPL